MTYAWIEEERIYSEHCSHRPNDLSVSEDAKKNDSAVVAETSVARRPHSSLSSHREEAEAASRQMH